MNALCPYRSNSASHPGSNLGARRTCCDGLLRPGKESLFIIVHPCFIRLLPYSARRIQRLDALAQLPHLLAGSNKTSQLLREQPLETIRIGNEGVTMRFD